ncbi:MAG: hypothetical protein AB1567_02355 [bacterium]
MSRNFLISSMVVVSLFFPTYCFTGIFDDFKIMDKEEIEKIKKENEVLKQENANLKQQLANTQKISYQNIAQTKYKTTASVSDDHLIDGDKKGVKWTPKWYELDFHYSRLINKVIVYLTPAEEVININLSFYYYDSESQRWDILRTLNNEGKNIITLTFNPLNISKLKIYPTTNNPNLPFPIAEVEVFGWVIEE